MRFSTPQEAIEYFYKYRHYGSQRIRVHYGDTSTGRDWGGVYDVSGYIGRSTGRTPIYLMIANSRSHGGGGILMDSIVRIRFANRANGGDLYRHPNYTPPAREDHPTDWDKHFA